MIRSCLLHDTIAARLSKKINHVTEYQRFSQYRAKAARILVMERAQQQLEQGLDNRIYLKIEEITDTTGRLYRQLQRFVSTPFLKFNAVLGKSVYSMSILFRLLGQFVIMTVIGLGLIYSAEWLATQQVPPFSTAIAQVFSNRIFQLGCIFLVGINVRTILFRLGDKDV